MCQAGTEPGTEWVLITLVTIIDAVLRSHLLLAAVYLLALPWFPFPAVWQVSPGSPILPGTWSRPSTHRCLLLDLTPEQIPKPAIRHDRRKGTIARETEKLVSSSVR